MEMFTSAVMRSTEAVDLIACPLDERAPGRHWIAERRRLKESWHLSQLRVVLYGLSHFSASMETSLKTVASFAKPPLAERTRGVNEACSTSWILWL